MKIYCTVTHIIGLIIILTFITHSSSNAQVSINIPCKPPTFATISKNNEISSVEIIENNYTISTPAVYMNANNAGKEVITSAYLTYNSSNSIYYNLKVIAKGSGSVGIYIDYDMNNVPDDFKLLTFQGNDLYSIYFTLNQALIKGNKIRIFVLNTSLRTINNASFCSKTYKVGELESYVFNTFRRNVVKDTAKVATADISGGGLLGSDITITIQSNGIPPPWEVLVGPKFDSSSSTVITDANNMFSGVKMDQFFYVDKSPFSFPSARAGSYRIKAVNGNTDGNGIAIVYIDNRDSSEVFVWNAVSPNGDGKNDVFKIEIPTRLFNTSAKIVIFDREGTKLSDSDFMIDNNLSINDAGNMFTYFWDCKNEKGQLLNPGSYYFSFKVKGYENDKRASKSGFIEIRR